VTCSEHHHAAEYLLSQLEGYGRIAIAGSIRRGKPDPKDIELVIEPAPGGHLENRLWDLQMTGLLLIDPTHKASGPRYQRRSHQGIGVDIFIVRPPAEWGLILFIRTGPAAFSVRALAQWKRVSNGGFTQAGALRDRFGTIHHTPEESDVFEALQMAPLRPCERA
jgi:DNA polymerase/3'-5' exonuclease PolX